MTFTDTAGEKPLYNSIIIDNYIKLLRKRYPYVDIQALLGHSEMSQYQVDDPGHWFSQRQINLFHEKVVQLTGKQDIAREAGAYSVSPDTLGMMRRYTLSLLGPVKICEMLEKWSGKFTRSAEYKAKKINKNTVEVVVTPFPGVQELPFQCRNRIGYFDGISRLFEEKSPKISQTQCLADGDSCCRYIVTFPKSRTDLLMKARLLVALFMTMAVVILFNTTDHGQIPYPVISLCLMIFLSVGWVTEYLLKRNLFDSINKIRDTSEELIEQTNINYNHALMINETGKILCSQTDTDGILAKVVSVLEKRLDYGRALILLSNSDKTRLIPCAGFGHSDEQITLLKEWPGFHLDQENSSGVFVNSFREKKPFLVNDFNEIKEQHSPRSREFAQKMGIKSFICCPVFYEDESLGILAVDNVKSGRPLLERDLNLLMGVAQQIGVALHSVGLESKLRHAQKMEAISTLARGIAHDFNNIMTGIISYADIAVFEAMDGKPINESISKIKQAGFRAQDLVKQLSTFSREVAQNRKLLNLPALINESADLLRATLPENITMEIDLCSECRQIFGDETHIYQVIMNLLINAVHAMADTGGILSVSLKNRVITTAESSGYSDLMPGHYLKLTISDTGHGMSPEVLERIFEPYFTTKERGKGSGIGLAVVHGIVLKHNGMISVESKSGKGTSFQVLLPDSKIQARLDSREAEKLPGGDQHILIIDDERFFADLLKHMLAPLGYQVEVSTDGIAALADFSRNPKAYHLIITDYSMPKMNGLELFKKVRMIRPDIPVILCTGFSETVSRDIALGSGVNYYFQKPVLQKELAFAVHQVLNNKDVKQYIL